MDRHLKKAVWSCSREGQRTLLSALLGALTVLLAVLLLSAPGTIDVAIFMKWLENIMNEGIVGGYARNATVQLPLYAVIFWAIGTVATWLHVSLLVAYKASLLLAWLATGLCLRRWTSDGLVVWAVLIAFLPSIALGYFDIYHAPPLLIAMWAAKEERWATFSAAFSIFLLIKAQAILFAPFAVVFVMATAWRNRGSLALLARLFVPAGAIALAIVYFFGNELRLSLQRATGDQFLSGNALNACWLITHWARAMHPEWFGPLQPDGTATFILTGNFPLAWRVMRDAFFVVYGGILALYCRRASSFEAFALFSFVGFLAYFTLNTGVHENHLFYGALFSVILCLFDRKYLRFALVCSLAANVNLILFYGLTGSEPPFHRVVLVDLALPLAVVNIVFFLLCVAELFVINPALDAT